MATINIPDDVILPPPETEKERMLYTALQDFFIQLKQTLSEIESKLT